MLLLGICRLKISTFGLFRVDIRFSFQNCYLGYRKRSRGLNYGRSRLTLLFIFCEELQMLDMFDLQDDCIDKIVLKSLCFSSVQIESVEDGIVDISNSRGREKLE